MSERDVNAVADGAALTKQPPRERSRPLWPHQVYGIAAARAAYREGKRAILLVCPTGGGKTTIGVEFVQGALGKGGRVLWLAHRKELLEQARARLISEGLERVGVIAPWADPDPGASVHVASVQTLVARLDAGIKKRHPDEERLQVKLDRVEALRKGATADGEREAATFAAEKVREHIAHLLRDVAPTCLPNATVVVFDEAHHYVADTWGLVAAYYASATKLGLTATPERSDGKAMGDLFDCLIPVSSVAELQALGVLVPCVTISPENPGKDLAAEVTDAYKMYCPGEMCFCFCINVAHAEATAAQFRASGVPAAVIHANTPWKMRSGILRAFAAQDPTPLREAGSVDDAPLVLCNVGTLTEGIDVVRASACIWAKRVGHVGAGMQMVGRVLRASPGAVPPKSRAIFVDLCGSVMKNEWCKPGYGFAETPREYSLDGKAISIAGEKAPAVKACLACGHVFSEWKVGAGGVRECPECGEPAPLPEQPRVKERELMAMGQATPEELRRTALHSLALQAVQSEYKSGWVVHAYRERFGDVPDRAALRDAMRWARAPEGTCSSESYASPEKMRERVEYYRAVGRAAPDEWQEIPYPT